MHLSTIENRNEQILANFNKFQWETEVQILMK